MSYGCKVLTLFFGLVPATGRLECIREAPVLELFQVNLSLSCVARLASVRCVKVK